MKSKLYSLLILALLFFNATSVDASGPLGGDISYTCKGNGKYDVFVTVYRDCNGIAMSQSNLIAKCSTATITVSNQTKISTKDVTGVGKDCPQGSRCNGTFQYGIEEIIWQMELDLSSYGSSYCEWSLGWETCCRMTNITTGYSNTNFYMHAQLNKCLSACNSSPKFLLPPKMLLCHSQDAIFNVGARDTVDSGDSLSYHLVLPLQGAGSSSWPIGNFSATRPLTFFGFPNNNLQWPAGFTLDPVTGDLLFRPTVLNQVGVIVVEVKEWRTINGTPTVIGVTRREFIAIVTNCGSSQVTLSPPFAKQACAGQETCFSISTDDDDSGDSTRITWSGGIKGATFTNNNGTVRLASGQLCWTPDTSDVSNIPYVTYVTAYDNNCPLNTTTSRAYSFFVRTTPEAILHDTVLDCGRLALDYTITRNAYGNVPRYDIYDTSRNLRWRSEVKQDTAVLPPGKYFVQLRINSHTPCVNIYEDTVIIPDYVQVNLPSDTSICFDDAVQLTGALSGGMAPYSFNWRDRLSNQSLSSTNNPETFQPIADMFYELTVSDGMGCSHSDSIYVKVNALPNVDIGPLQAICKDDTVVLDAGGDTLGWKYYWKNGDTTQTSYFGADSSIWVQVRDSNGCVNYDTTLVVVNPGYIGNANDLTACTGDTVISDIGGSLHFYWYRLSSYKGDGMDVPFSNQSQLTMRLDSTEHFIIEGSNPWMGVTCSVFDTVTFTARPLPLVNIGADQRICAGDSVQLSSTGSSGSSYLWNTGDTTASIWVGNAGMYQVKVKDAFACENTDSMQLTFLQIPLDAGMSQTTCANDTVYLYAGGADSIRWYDAGTFNPGSSNVVANFGDTFSYLASKPFTWLVEGIQTDQGLTCTAWDTVSSDLYPQTILLNIQGSTAPDSVNAFTYSVDPSGQSSVNWTVHNGTIQSGQGTAVVQVIWLHPGTGTITAEGVSPDGCTSEVSLQVNIQATSFRVPKEAGFKIYPNPVRDWLFISFEDGTESGAYVISNALGQDVLKGAFQSSETRINLELLPSGVYLLQIEGRGAVRIVVE